MILAAAPEAIALGEQVLRLHALEKYVPLPAESHRLFGAGFLLLGMFFVMETVAGKVWHRNEWRTQFWPATLVFLGWGMIMVTLLDPNDRIPHLLIGCAMMAAGLAERRHRMRKMSRSKADMFVVPAMLLGALEIGVLHSHGAISSQAFIVHATLGVFAVTIGPLRLYQAAQPDSHLRSALIAITVIALSITLLGPSHDPGAAL